MAKINTTPAETRLLTTLIYTSFAFGVFQLILQASPVVVILSVLSGLIAILPCFFYGLGRTVGVLYLMVWFQVSFGALLTKSMLLQPLDSNLFSPVFSHLILLVGAIAFSASALLAYTFTPLHKDLIRPELNPRRLTALAAIFAGLWASAMIVGKLGANGAAIAVFLRNYIFLAFVCETAATILRSNGTRTFSFFGAALFAVTIAFSISVNSKAGILGIGVCYFLTLLAFGRRPSLRVVGALVPAFAILTIAINPAIHVVRAQRDRLNPFEIMAATTSTAVGILIGDEDTVAKVDSLKRQEFQAGYNLYRNRYLGRSDVWFDRFILTGYIDAITRRVTYDGPFFGWNYILSQTAEALPRQLYGATKNRYSSGARITRTLGLTERDAAVSPTVPLPIELFVAAGFPAILILGIPTLAFAISALNLVANTFRRNVWSIGFLGIYGYFFAVQTYSGYIFFTLRQIPTDAIVITLAGVLTSIIIGSVTERGGGERGGDPKGGHPSRSFSPARRGARPLN